VGSNEASHNNDASGTVGRGDNLAFQLSLIATEYGRGGLTARRTCFQYRAARARRAARGLNNINLALHISDKMATPVSRIYGELRQLDYATVAVRQWGGWKTMKSKLR
jgi:hypothetical protein